MRRYLPFTLCLCALVASSLLSCNMVSYPGAYKSDGFYEGSRQAYLYFQDETDTLIYYSFGIRPQEELEHIIEIPVRMLGVPAPTEVGIGVVVDPTLTTAEENVHYELLDKKLLFPKDSLSSRIRIKLLRSHIGNTPEDTKELVLGLMATSELDVAFPEQNKVRVRFDDNFDTSEIETYWNSSFSGLLGPFDRMIFMKFLEYYEFDLDAMWANFWGTDMFLKWAMTKEFFDNHPEYGKTVVVEDWMKVYTPLP